MPKNSSGRSTWDAIALLGFLILTIVVIWGAVHAARLAAPYFASLFPNKSPNKVEVTAPGSITPGVPFTIRWNYPNATEGKYIFLYQCRNGLQFLAAEETVPCGAAFPITTEDSLTLEAKYSGDREMQVPVSIIFVPKQEGAERVQGGVTLKVNPSSHSGSEPTAPETPSTIKPTPVPSTGGKADLKVTILAVGVIHPITGQFLNIAPANSGDMVAVQFDIANVGQSSTGTWYFEAALPTTGGFVYFSPAQYPLGPGDHVVNTLRFTDAAPGGGIVSIQVDPANLVSEVSDGNNYSSQHLYVPYYASPYIY